MASLQWSSFLEWWTARGFDYLKNPPALILKSSGLLIRLHPRKIAINALKDEGGAGKILKWLIAEINTAWERCGEIEPCFEAVPKPGSLEILRHLPRINCRKCNEPACLVFASRLTAGAKATSDCPRTVKRRRARAGRLSGSISF